MQHRNTWNLKPLVRWNEKKIISIKIARKLVRQDQIAFVEREVKRGIKEKALEWCKQRNNEGNRKWCRQDNVLF